MKGSCLCGKCSFEVVGDPGPVGKCHCSKCRKVSGTGSNAVFWIAPDSFKWLSGEENAKTYSLPDGWRSVFCNDCGSPIPAFVEGSPLPEFAGSGMWIVPAGLMDEEVNVGVRGHIWVENKPEWDVIGDDAPQFMKVPPG